jgi:hypothetical protein
MGKFKYEKYNYSKIGIKPKLRFQYSVSEYEYDALKNIFCAENGKLANILAEELKKAYAFRYSESREKNYDINDIDFEWEVITPVGTFKSDETSS